MSEATLIYPQQLFSIHPAIQSGRPIYLIEESLLLTHNPIHRQKLIFHKLSLDAYEVFLHAAGHQVVRITLSACTTTTSVFTRLKKDGIKTIHVVDTTDAYLEKAIAASGLERVWHESPQFILEKQDAIDRFVASKRQMARFYKQLRTDKNILLEKDGSPTGGQWSFDADNRKKIPKSTPLPTEPVLEQSPEITAAAAWADSLGAESYGDTGCWLPVTHKAAEVFLQDFLHDRFDQFGPFEDALHTEGTRLWHSALSPLLNCGLLTPQYVLTTALSYATTHDIPLNSTEGFVRQILGWREFMRASYESDGATMRQQNFFNHTRSLPKSFWNGTTNLIPVDHAITTALAFGYNHHIDRLMVLGNVMLLSQVHPDEVYSWFMSMYVDAYDWVMVPNVYGMSQFADGGSFATKPYISGSNYLKKMSNFPAGHWEETWTALYWNFIDTHQDFFKSNHRLSMMPRLLEKMEPEKKAAHISVAKHYLENTDQ